MWGPLAAGRPRVAVSDDKGPRVGESRRQERDLQFDSSAEGLEQILTRAPAEAPTGTGVDPMRFKLFSTCNNKTLVIADTDKLQVVQTLPIFRPRRLRSRSSTVLIFASSGGDGTVRGHPRERARKYEFAKSIKTQVCAKTIALDPKTPRLYPLGRDTRSRPPMPTRPRSADSDISLIHLWSRSCE